MQLVMIIFWICIAFMVYSSFIYILILKLFKRKHFLIDDNFNPSITLIISAYNEEKNIESKLKNTMELDYPNENLQIILVDDGSTDKTVEIAKNFEHVEILKLMRGGKTFAQNEAVKIANNEILVFSDTNNEYKRDSLKKLVRNFVDENIGVVCGELRYRGKYSEENAYWKYELLIKNTENKIGWLLGANGSIYAVRKKAYVPLPQDAISDHLEPIMIYGNGLDVIYEPEAIAIEDAPIEVLIRKRRIVLRSLVSMKYLFPLLNPFKKRSIFIPYISHKLIRWFFPILLIICLVTSAILAQHSYIYGILLFLQISFYIAGICSK